MRAGADVVHHHVRVGDGADTKDKATKEERSESHAVNRTASRAILSMDRHAKGTDSVSSAYARRCPMCVPWFDTCRLGYVRALAAYSVIFLSGEQFCRFPQSYLERPNFRPEEETLP